MIQSVQQLLKYLAQFSLKVFLKFLSILWWPGAWPWLDLCFDAQLVPCNMSIEVSLNLLYLGFPHALTKGWNDSFMTHEREKTLTISLAHAWYDATNFIKFKAFKCTLLFDLITLLIDSRWVIHSLRAICRILVQPTQVIIMSSLILSKIPIPSAFKHRKQNPGSFGLILTRVFELMSTRWRSGDRDQSEIGMKNLKTGLIRSERIFLTSPSVWTKSRSSDTIRFINWNKTIVPL